MNFREFDPLDNEDYQEDDELPISEIGDDCPLDDEEEEDFEWDDPEDILDEEED